MGKDTAIEMFVGGLVMDPNTQAPVIVLKDEKEEVHLPIWIGIAEATSIASAIKQLTMSRPLTHDLMFEALTTLGARVERIVLTDLKESTYFAELILSVGERAIILDSRPSDAIALAIRASAPIFVVQKVLDQAKISIEKGQPQGGDAGEAGSDPQEDSSAESSQDFKQIDKSRWEEILAELDPDDFKYKM